MNNTASKLSDLPCIGKQLETELISVGITDPDELYKNGTQKTFLRLFEKYPDSCMHKLLAIEGAVSGMPKKAIPESKRAELRQFFNSLK